MTPVHGATSRGAASHSPAGHLTSAAHAGVSVLHVLAGVPNKQS
jgi:hypothetical protein